MKKVLMMALMLATVISVDVMAQPGGGNKPEFDENGCVVIKEEMAEKMAAADADADGCVTEEEMKAARPEGGRGGKGKRAK